MLKILTFALFLSFPALAESSLEIVSIRQGDYEAAVGLRLDGESLQARCLTMDGYLHQCADVPNEIGERLEGRAALAPQRIDLNQDGVVDHKDEQSIGSLR